jgi:hypothetical protein
LSSETEDNIVSLLDPISIPVYAADIARVVGAAARVLATCLGSNEGEIDA